MQHLDEGTIHAWLDGALDVEESARVEQHAAGCAVCAAAVAEARGLVAGSTRILSALDGVPGGVLPRTVAGTGRGRDLKAQRDARSAWRVLRLTPARAAAAAIVVVAAGTALVYRGAKKEHTAMSPFDVVAVKADSTVPKELAPTPRVALPPAPPRPSSADVAGAGSIAASRGARGLGGPGQSVLPTAPLADAAVRRGAPNVAQNTAAEKQAASEQMREVRGQAARGNAGFAAKADRLQPLALADSTASRDSTTALERARIGSMAGALREERQGRALRATAVTPTSVDAPSAARVSSSAAPAAAPSPPPSLQGGGSRREFAGCYTLASDVPDTGLPLTVTLDSALALSESVSMRRVRIPDSNFTKRGAAVGYWTESAGSVRVVLHGPPIRVLTLQADARGALSGTVEGQPTMRVTLRRCVER